MFYAELGLENLATLVPFFLKLKVVDSDLPGFNPLPVEAEDVSLKWMALVHEKRKWNVVVYYSVYKQH